MHSFPNSRDLEHVSGLGRYHLGQTDNREAQYPPPILGKTSTNYILPSSIARANVFPFVLVLAG